LRLLCPTADVDEALSILHKHGVSQETMDIGEIPFTSPTPHQALVSLETRYGNHRILDLLPGEQLPRIC
jgi:hydrogenase expression/formation protein HypE